MVSWLRTAGNLWIEIYPRTGLGPYAKFIVECAQNTGLQLSGDKVFSMVSRVMSTEYLDFSAVDEYVQSLLDIGAVLKGRAVFCWSDPAEPSLPRFGIGPDHIQTGDEMIAVKRPSSGEHSFQVAIIVRDLTPNSARLVGDSILVLSFSNANFWFPVPQRTISLG